MSSTAEVAERIGVSKNTLLRWIAEGRLRDVARDWRNWRVWREADIERARLLRDQLHGAAAATVDSPKNDGLKVYATDLTRLGHGREHRSASSGERGESAKVEVLTAYSTDLTRLGEGRSRRAK